MDRLRASNLQPAFTSRAASDFRRPTNSRGRRLDGVAAESAATGPPMSFGRRAASASFIQSSPSRVDVRSSNGGNHPPVVPLMCKTYIRAACVGFCVRVRTLASQQHLERMAIRLLSYPSQIASCSLVRSVRGCRAKKSSRQVAENAKDAKDLVEQTISVVTVRRILCSSSPKTPH